MKQKCKYCNKIIEYENGREFSCHCASCKFNPNVLKKYEKAVQTRNKRYRKDYNFYCKKCGKEYILNLTYKCSITVGELKDKIKKWEIKYGPFV